MVAEGPAPGPQLSAASPATSPVLSVLLRDGGLRARWRFLIFVALWAFCERTLFFAAGPLFGRAQSSRLPLSALLIWLLSFLAVAIPTAVMARIEHRPLGAYGLPARGAFGVLFWRGAAWGLVALTGRMLALRAVGAFYFGKVALHGLDVAWYGASWAVVFLMIALFVQCMLLGYPQVVLTNRIGFWPAAAVLSFFFGTIHLAKSEWISGRFGVDWASGLFTGLLALFFCLTLRRTGNLWFVVGVDTFFNWGDAFLYSAQQRAAGRRPPPQFACSRFGVAHWRYRHFRFHDVGGAVCRLSPEISGCAVSGPNTPGICPGPHESKL